MPVLTNIYDDLIPGAIYVFQMENTDQDFTDVGLTVDFDMHSPSGTVTIHKEKGDSGVTVTATLVTITLTAIETETFTDDPGQARVLWRVNGQAIGSIALVDVTPMPGVLS